jgi:hypothetical protein
MSSNHPATPTLYVKVGDEYRSATVDEVLQV